jgi:hypothetical protein
VRTIVPVLTIVTGHPTAEETAAVTVVLTALAAAGTQAPAANQDSAANQASAWRSRERLLRAPLHPAPGAWRASALPR